MGELKHVGYFPSVQFKKFLSYFQDLGKLERQKKTPHILTLYCYREKETHSDQTRPLPYVQIILRAEKGAYVDFEWRRHQFLDIDSLSTALFKDGALDDLAVKSFSISLEKESVLGKSGAEADKKSMGTSFGTWSPRVVAIFELAHIGEKETKIASIVRENTDEDWLKTGGKLSCIDLIALQDQEAWTRNIRRDNTFYDVGSVPKIARNVLYDIAYGDFPRIRSYTKGKKDEWILAEDKAVKDWRV